MAVIFYRFKPRPQGTTRTLTPLVPGGGEGEYFHPIPIWHYVTKQDKAEQLMINLKTTFLNWGIDKVMG